MLTSLINVLGDVELHQTAMPQQVEIFRQVKAHGHSPVVIDAREVLNSPADILTRLCSQLGIPFSNQMLSWPPGPRQTDGVWGKHWYANVYKTTTFGKYRRKNEVLPSRYAEMLKHCEQLYSEMAEYRIRV
jgi:hypothetical protein